MRLLIITILLVLTTQISFAQQCNSGCTKTAPGSSNYDLAGNETLCVVENVTISSMNMNNSNNTICIKTGMTLNGSMNLGNVTVNVYGTFNFSGNVNAGVVFNIYSGGTLNYSGTNLNSGTINNSGTIIFSSTDQNGIRIQGVTINNNTGGTFIATAPNKVTFNQGSFTNNGTVTFTKVENQEGNFTNNAGASLTFQNGTFQHGALHNYGAISVNCPNNVGNDCSSQNPCFMLGNKNAGQFTNEAGASLAIHGTMCLDAQVVFHNNGAITVDKNLTISGGGQIAQGNGGSTTVGGTTTVPGNSSISGGNICSNTTNNNGSITSTQSCGTAPTINNLTGTTCKNIAVSVNIPVTIPSSAPSGTTVSWSSLKIINGTDTVSATATNPTLTVTAKGTYKIYYNSTSASVLYTPVTGYTGSNVISYKIGSLSGSTVTYASVKTLTTTVNAPPNKPTLVISNP